MKNLILMNYEIEVENIYFKNDSYFFYYNDVKIYIVKYKGEEKKLFELIELCNAIYYKMIPVNTFILSKNGNYFIKKDDYYILLMRVNSYENYIDLSKILIFNNYFINNKINSFSINKEWENEIDLIENELIEYNTEYIIIQKSIDYFIGMAENAIELINNYESLIESNNNTIGHKVTYKIYDDNCLYNPFTFIRVNRVYDISNYIKYKFLKNDVDYEEVEKIFNSCSEYEENYLFACLLYPNIYFDLIKKVLLKKEEEIKVNDYIKNIYNYNNLLKICKNYVKNKSNINLIKWLN